MRFEQPLLQLPISFCADTLAAEVGALPPSAWEPHPTGFVGNEAVLLVTPNGQLTQAIEGPMGPTRHLLACRYMMEVMAAIGAVWGRSRLMGLAAGAEVPAHVDSHYYWRTHIRIHIPVVTNPGVRFTCGDQSVHMAPGECWVFDSFRWHDVQNKGDERRIHLVLDTVGGGRLGELIEAAQARGTAAGPAAKLLPGQAPAAPLQFEQVNAPQVMSPWEIRCHLAFLAEEAVPHPRLATVLRRLDKFADSWAAAWARFGTAREGYRAYAQLVGAARRDIAALGANALLLKNELQLGFVADQLVFEMALMPLAAPAPVRPAAGDRRLAS
jgi:hypothetical protein